MIEIESNASAVTTTHAKLLFNFLSNEGCKYVPSTFYIPITAFLGVEFYQLNLLKLYAFAGYYINRCCFYFYYHYLLSTLSRK